MNLKTIIAEAKAGSHRAANEIIVHFEPLIKSTLNKKGYYSNIMTREDFAQLHRLGIWMAIDTFPTHFYKIKIDSNNKPIFKEFDGTHRFIGWMKTCMQHHVTKELRKEHQKCRTVDLVYLDDEINREDEVKMVDKIPAIRSFQEAFHGFSERLQETLTEKEAKCFHYIANEYTYSNMATEIQKQYPTLSGKDIKIIKANMLHKVKREVVGYV